MIVVSVQNLGNIIDALIDSIIGNTFQSELIFEDN
jgi:hypothetical protein